MESSFYERVMAEYLAEQRLDKQFVARMARLARWSFGTPPVPHPVLAPTNAR